MRLYIVRHGQSQGNVLMSVHGRKDYPLTELGKAQAQSLNKTLFDIPFARCYTSPLIRARETAKIILQGRDIPLEQTDLLLEQDMGELEGLPWDDAVNIYGEEYMRALYDSAKSREVLPIGGNGFFDMRRDAAKFIDIIKQRNEDALVVGHFGSISALLCQLFDLPDTLMDNVVYQQGHYSCVEIGDKTRLICFNR